MIENKFISRQWVNAWQKHLFVLFWEQISNACSSFYVEYHRRTRINQNCFCSLLSLRSLNFLLEVWISLQITFTILSVVSIVEFVKSKKDIYTSSVVETCLSISVLFYSAIRWLTSGRCRGRQADVLLKNEKYI